MSSLLEKKNRLGSQAAVTWARNELIPNLEKSIAREDPRRLVRIPYILKQTMVYVTNRYVFVFTDFEPVASKIKGHFEKAYRCKMLRIRLDKYVVILRVA